MRSRVRPLKSFARAVGVAAVLATFGLANHASAATAIVLGDSIGVGLSMAGGSARLAHNSVSIRSTDAINQINRVPAGKVAVLSLGTNDAVGNIRGVESGIDRIAATVAAAGIHLVWVGPPCVFKPWNANVVKLDQILRARLAGKPGISYVSAADQSVCDHGLRAGDGVHFNMRGYGMLWARARAAGGFGDGGASDGPVVAENPTKHHAHAKRARKVRLARLAHRNPPTAAGAPAAPSSEPAR